MPDGFVPRYRRSRSRALSGVGGDQPPSVGVQAGRAFDFWDGVGVNVHLASTNVVGGVPTNAYADEAAVIEFLTRMNFRHVRESSTGKNPGAMARANAVGAAGIRLNIIALWPAQPRPLSWPAGLLDYYFANGLNINYVESWEGANEQNLPNHNQLPVNPPGINGFIESQWAQATLAHQTELHTTAHAASRPAAWRAVPVIGWSYANPNNSAPTSRIVQCSTVADWDATVDYANMHMYIPGHTSSGVNPGLANVRQYIYNDLTKPMVVSETGYHNLMTHTGSHPPTPEDAAAWYAVKNPFVWMKNGVKRVFFYEAIDEYPPNDPVRLNQGHFGFAEYKDPTQAGLFVEKPRGTAVKNLLAIYKDAAGANYAAGKLDYTITQSAPNLSVDLRQRATDNAFLLALYRDVNLFTRTGPTPPYGTYPSVPDVNVTVDLGGAFTTVEHRRPSAVVGAGGGPTLVETFSNVSTVTVGVGKHLSVLVITGPLGPPVDPPPTGSSEYGTAIYGTSIYGS